ncbi:hypothetical protein [Tautonia plasticadhaerens]|uniref:Uncharacterized protein n=1 Tax=Tautonia plasticadhaerens TaxID=2527974 RepID=A0A518HCI9_9BACT|nr:hypothetical protein [Tautonia plasticadhaerens]QDV38573.1 hypothetical protein ElP_65280 [Tautonia plasticadhaerens]
MMPIESLPRPTLLVALLLVASPLVGCGKDAAQRQEDAGLRDAGRASQDEAGVVAGLERLPSTDDGDPRPSGTYLDPEMPDAEVSAPAPNVDLPGLEGNTDARGAAGAANARGAAVDASSSPAEAAELGTAPEGAVRDPGSDDPSADATVDADSP